MAKQKPREYPYPTQEEFVFMMWDVAQRYNNEIIAIQSGTDSFKDAKRAENRRFYYKFEQAERDGYITRVKMEYLPNDGEKRTYRFTESGIAYGKGLEGKYETSYRSRRVSEKPTKSPPRGGVADRANHTGRDVRDDASSVPPRRSNHRKPDKIRLIPVDP